MEKKGFQNRRIWICILVLPLSYIYLMCDLEKVIHPLVPFLHLQTRINHIPTTECYKDSDTASEKCFIQNICSKSKLFTANIIIASTLVFIHSTKIHWSSIICRSHVLINMPKPQDPPRLTFNMWIKWGKCGKPLVLCPEYRKFVSPPTTCTENEVASWIIKKGLTECVS